jgi:uncharacterized RDD family membrane protein YckC
MAYQGNQGTPGYPGYPGTPGPNPSNYADWITRVGAYLIDYAPVVVVWVLFAIIAGAIGSAVFTVILYLLAAIGTIGYWVYNRWILGGQGQTLGKKQLKIKLVSEETGEPIGTLNAFIRDICHIVDGIICDIGYLFPLWDPKRQTLADKIMKTVVVPA